MITNIFLANILSDANRLILDSNMMATAEIFKHYPNEQRYTVFVGGGL